MIMMMIMMMIMIVVRKQELTFYLFYSILFYLFIFYKRVLYSLERETCIKILVMMVQLWL